MIVAQQKGRAKEKRGKEKKRKKEKKKKEEEEKKDKAKRCKEKLQGAALLHDQEKADLGGKSLGGLPSPGKDSWACCSCPIAAAASQIMFIALK